MLAWEQSLKELAASQLLCYLQGLSQSKAPWYILVSSLISCIWCVRSWRRRDPCYLVISRIEKEKVRRRGVRRISHKILTRAANFLAYPLFTYMI